MRFLKTFKLITLTLSFNFFILNGFKVNDFSNSVNALPLSNAEELFKQGKALYYRDNYEAAIRIWLQALAAYQNNNPLKESEILSNLSFAYLRMKNAPEALKYAQQAVQKSEGTHLDAQSFALFALGESYNSYERYPDAVIAYEKALLITQKTDDPRTKAQILIGLGEAYTSWAKYAQAIKVFEDAKKWAKETQNSRVEEQAEEHLDYLRFMVSNPGYRDSEFDESFKKCEINGENNYLNYRKKAECFRDLGAKGQEMSAQIEAGSICFDLGDYGCALDSFSQALVVSQEVGVREREAEVLQRIAILFNRQNRPELAIIFLKQAVSIYESIRAESKSLPSELQTAYIQQVGQTYRDLADLLLQKDRVLEAQQVLDLLKVQELNTYLREVRGGDQPLIILRPEEDILKEYNGRQKKAVEFGKELAQLRKRDAQNTLNLQEKQRLKQLSEAETRIQTQFNEFIDSPSVRALVAQLSQTTRDQNLKLDDLAALQSDLTKLDAAILYPLILEDRLELVITTPNSPPLRRIVPIKRTELNAAILAFRTALRDPNQDPKPSAQKLYSWLIQPLEADLQAANIKAIIYAPDGQLRYIPLAALHDGQQWLIEKYRINNITARSLVRGLVNPPSKAQPTVLAGAFANGHYQFTEGGRSYDFSGLSGAEQEVKTLQATIPNAVSLFDKNFSLSGTQPRMNSFSIVHLATHGAFVVGKPENSFILFGDGQRAKLTDIRNWRLSNVDLMVLSACETGLGEITKGDGVEILGLGYQFQQAGAKATIASLWLVSDNGTEKLMTAFYKLLKQSGISKAEALRQAQIAVIREDKELLSPSRGIGETFRADDRGSFKIESTPDGKTPAITRNLSHPYYWAPFILIGNGL